MRQTNESAPRSAQNLLSELDPFSSIPSERPGVPHFGRNDVTAGGGEAHGLLGRDHVLVRVLWDSQTRIRIVHWHA